MKYRLTVEYEAKDDIDAETIAQEITETIYDIPKGYRSMSGRNEDAEEGVMYFLLGKSVEVCGPMKVDE
jgi:hypothetical protein